jgi:hypothetical protein
VNNSWPDSAQRLASSHPGAISPSGASGIAVAVSSKGATGRDLASACLHLAEGIGESSTAAHRGCVSPHLWVF